MAAEVLRGRVLLPIRQREGIVLRLNLLHRNQRRRGRSYQDSGERQAQAPLPTSAGARPVSPPESRVPPTPHCSQPQISPRGV